MVLRLRNRDGISTFAKNYDMEQFENESIPPTDDVIEPDVVEIVRSTNANLGMTAYGKAYLFKKEQLEEMQEKSAGQKIQIKQLVDICSKQGRDIDNSWFAIGLVARDTPDDDWYASVSTLSDDKDEEL